MCLEWEDFIAFEAWAMANGYDENLEIDRVNNNGWYSPENCEWVSRNQQMRNTRKTHQVVLNGELRCVIDWCNTLGIHKTNAYKAAKNIGIRVDEYLAFKYYNPGAICTKENFAAWNLVCAMELEERLGYKFDKEGKEG
ncbi:MAG: hypothetical protein GX660_03300 [Clostridiaceae bacterium]|nr:hypothetical protein [Clostridiaceae bacterium]